MPAAVESSHAAVRLTTNDCRVVGVVEAGEILVRAREPFEVSKALERVLAAVELRFTQTLGNGGLLSKPAVVCAVSLMHELSRSRTSWPSTKHLQALPLLWGDSELERLQGTHASQLINSLRAEASLVYDMVVLPSIPATHVDSFTAADVASMAETFFSAMALQRSRCLPFDEATLNPFGEHLHGLPNGGAECNVELEHAPSPAGVEHSSNGTRAFRIARATRTIEAGEKLVFGLGPMSSAEYFSRYGAVPTSPDASHSTAELSNPLDRIAVQLSPRILSLAGGGRSSGREVSRTGPSADLSSPSVLLRQRVLSMVGFQADSSEVGSFEFCASELEVYLTRFKGPPALGQLRSLLVLLAIATDEQVGLCFRSEWALECGWPSGDGCIGVRFLCGRCDV